MPRRQAIRDAKMVPLWERFSRTLCGRLAKAAKAGKIAKKAKIAKIRRLGLIDPMLLAHCHLIDAMQVFEDGKALPTQVDNLSRITAWALFHSGQK